MTLYTVSTGNVIAAQDINQLVDSLTSVYFNVQDYGATGNGTSEDTSSIQAAITALEAAGSGTLVFPYGVYLCGKLTIKKAQTWIGLGGWGASDAQGAKIKAKSGLNDHLIEFAPVSGPIVGARFSHLIFDGQGNNQTAGNIFEAYAAIHCYWEFCHFTKPWGIGLHLYHDGSGGTGHHNHVVQCLFDGGTSSNGGDGVGLIMEASDENFISLCDFENNGLGATSGTNRKYHLVDLSGLQNISNNVFVAPTNATYGMAIKVQGNDTLVHGNIFDGVGGTEVIRINGTNNTITSNRFYNIGNNGAQDGIVPDNIAETTIVGNMFLAGPSATSGVKLSVGPPTKCNIASNIFSGTFSSGAIIAGTGTGHSFDNNIGVNPVGQVTAPTFPATTVAATNTTGYDVHAYIANGTSAITQVQVAGVNGTYNNTNYQIAASGWGSVRIPAGGSVKFTYAGGTPAWTWFGD